MFFGVSGILSGITSLLYFLGVFSLVIGYFFGVDLVTVFCNLNNLKIDTIFL